jgi:Ca2+-binding RTX toxin-like protein
MHLGGNDQRQLGGNDVTINAVTLWSSGLLSLGQATPEQIDFMASGQSPIPGVDGDGFPGEFFLVDYTPDSPHVSYGYGLGRADYSAPYDPLDSSTSIKAAFFSFNGSFQIILDENGFSIVSETDTIGSTTNGYYIGSYAYQTSGSEIQFDTYPDFFTYPGTANDDTIVGTVYADRFLSSAGADHIDGGGLDHEIVGPFDVVSYASSPAGITVNLATGVGSGGDAEGDTLVNIEQLVGSAFADTLTGSSLSNDTIEGGPGADSLDGGTGFDTLSYSGSSGGVTVSLAHDTASGGDATGDTIVNFENVQGSGGNDVLEGSAIANDLNGGAGDDVLVGGAGNDSLYGGDGDDLLVGGPGADHLSGGAGSNTVGYSNSPAAVTINLETGILSGGDATGDYLAFSIENAIGSAFGDSLTGNSGNNRLEGGAGNDTLSGSDGDDVLSGGGGNDVLDGGFDTDMLSGGAGADAYYVDQQADLVFENAGEGTDTVYASAGFYLYTNIENLTLQSGAGDIFGVGNELANAITGNDGSNLLIGGGGNDTIHGGLAADSLFGQDGDDQLYGDGGIDYLVGGLGNDTLGGGARADALYGEDGNDNLSGGFTFDTDILVGGAGADVLHGDSGLGDYDRMDGGAGNDTYYVDTGDDLTFEAVGGGTETVYANVAGANNGVYLYANVEKLVLLGTTTFGVGNELANSLTGNASANWLLGGDGNYTLNGKGGNDVLFGQGGRDTFVFEKGTGGDVIGDFTHGQDKLNVHAFGFASFADLQSHFAQVGSDGAIYLDSTGSDFIVLQGVTMSTLDSGDFAL